MAAHSGQAHCTLRRGAVATPLMPELLADVSPKLPDMDGIPLPELEASPTVPPGPFWCTRKSCRPARGVPSLDWPLSAALSICAGMFWGSKVLYLFHKRPRGTYAHGLFHIHRVAESYSWLAAVPQICMAVLSLDLIIPDLE